MELSQHCVVESVGLKHISVKTPLGASRQAGGLEVGQRLRGLVALGLDHLSYTLVAIKPWANQFISPAASVR